MALSEYFIYALKNNEFSRNKLLNGFQPSALEKQNF